MDPYRISPVAHDDFSVALVERALKAHNESVVGPCEYEPVALALRGPDGVVVGGFYGYTGLGWLNVATLWVAEELRGRGYGRTLLEAGEAAARARGCTNAFLFTYDFQAPGFYRAMGYEEFAALEEFPRGHRRMFFRKALG